MSFYMSIFRFTIISIIINGLLATDTEEFAPTTYRPHNVHINNHKDNMKIPVIATRNNNLKEPLKSYMNDTVVNYVTVRPIDNEAETFTTDSDVIYVTTDNSVTDLISDPLEPDLGEAEDLTHGNIVARRFGLPAREPQVPKIEEPQSTTHENNDSWQPVWPFGQISPNTPTPLVTETPVARYPPDTFRNNRFPVTKEPITQYYFDLSNSLAPTGGPLFDPTSAEVVPTIPVDISGIISDYEPTATPAVRISSTPVLSRIIDIDSTNTLTLNTVNPIDQSADAGDDFPVTVVPSSFEITPTKSIDINVNTRLSPIPVDDLKQASTSTVSTTLESSITELNTGELVIESTSSLIQSPTNVIVNSITSTNRSVHSITVDNRTPLWVRLSQQMSSTIKTNLNNIPTVVHDTVVSKSLISQDDIPIGILSAGLPNYSLATTPESTNANFIGERSSVSSDVTSTPVTLTTPVVYSVASTSKPTVTFVSGLIPIELEDALHSRSVAPKETQSVDTVEPTSFVNAQITPESSHMITSSDLIPELPGSTHSRLLPSSPVESLSVETFSLTDVISPVSISPTSSSISSHTVSPTTPINIDHTSLETSLLDSNLLLGSSSTSATTTLPVTSMTDEYIDTTTIETLTDDEEPANLTFTGDAIHTDNALTSKASEPSPTIVPVNTDSVRPTAMADMETTETVTTPDSKEKFSYDLFTPTSTVTTPKVEETIELIEKSTGITESSTISATSEVTSAFETDTIPPPTGTKETPSTRIQTVLQPTSENDQPQLHLIEMHANGTNSTQISPYVKAAISYDPIEFCKHQENIRALLGEWVNKHLSNGTDDLDYEVRIFSQPNCSSLSNSESSDDNVFTDNTDLYFYVVDNGKINPNVTLQYPRNPTELEISKELQYLKAKVLHLELVSALSSGEDLMLGEEAVGTSIIAVSISLVLLFVFLVIGVLAFILIKRRRAADLAHGRRCTPAANDAYSMDSVSMYYHSFKRKSKKRASSKSLKSYLNQGFDDPNAPSRPLNFAKLTPFITDVEGIYEEFSNIPSVSPNYDEVPRGVEDKNRYANVIPLTETRVSLKGNGKNPADEYINANYIHGARNEAKYYIATQAPLDETVGDFWRMIWEHESKVIVMLTDFVERGIDKCADYLPPSETLDCHRVYGEFQVTLKSRDMREKYVVSHVQLKNLENNLVREIAHMWYTGWPALGIPKEEKTFISFIFETRAIRKKLRAKGPIIVHCSPGTGRTGTFIACDLSMRHFDDSKTVDIPKTVYKIRRERSGAVQTKEQYLYIYRVTNLYAAKLMTGNLDLF